MEFNLIFTMYSKGIYYINIDIQWYKKPDYILDNSLIVWHGTLFMQIHGCIELLLPSKWLELAIKIDPLSNKSYTRLSILYWVTNIILECFPSSWRVAKGIEWFHQRNFLTDYIYIYIYNIMNWLSQDEPNVDYEYFK